MANRLPVLWSARRTLREVVTQRVTHLVERVRSRWRTQDFESAAQRFGAQAWRRVVERWPALDGLVDERWKGAPGASVPPAAESSAPPAAADQGPTLGEAIRALRDESSWQGRVLAARALAEHKSAAAIDALLAAVRDPSAEVAVAVVDALGVQPEQRALIALRAVLTNADGYFSPITRVAALRRLAARATAEEWQPIYSALRDVDAEVSIAAMACIIEHQPSRAQEYLLPLLRDESGFFLPVVRLAAVNGLARAGALSRELAAELARAEREPDVLGVLARARE